MLKMSLISPKKAYNLILCYLIISPHSTFCKLFKKDCAFRHLKAASFVHINVDYNHK